MKSKAFTLLELMVVLMILGVGLMTLTPRIANEAIGVDERLLFFDELLKEHHTRAVELGMPVTFTGFKGSGNILTHDGERVTIPDVDSVQVAIVNGQETSSEEYLIRIYPDGLVDYFMLVFKDDDVVESVPILFQTRYGEYEED